MIGEISNMFKIEELLNKWDKNKPVSLEKYKNMLSVFDALIEIQKGVKVKINS